MKKLITILAIMIVVVGAAFADTRPNTGTAETHKLTVQTTVGVVLPSFSFSATNNNVTQATNATNPAKFDTSASTPDFKNETALVLANTDISNASISQQFDIISKTIANYNGGFVMTAEATAFTGTDDKGTSYTTKGTITYVYAHVSPAATEHITTSSVADSSVTVVYAGKQVSTNVNVGSVTVTWPQDTAAIPATYTADVTLTVTAQ